MKVLLIEEVSDVIYENSLRPTIYGYLFIPSMNRMVIKPYGNNTIKASYRYKARKATGKKEWECYSQVGDDGAYNVPAGPIYQVVREIDIPGKLINSIVRHLRLATEFSKLNKRFEKITSRNPLAAAVAISFLKARDVLKKSERRLKPTAQILHKIMLSD